MAKIRIAFFVVLLLQVGCKEKSHDNGTDGKSEQSSKLDTIVGRKIITDEIAGSSYRKRAVGYFVIANSDTSNVMFILSEAKIGGKVNLYFRESKDIDITYRQKLSELKKVLPEATKDFDMDSLSSISIGRLISNGDIAIDVTEEFQDSGISPPNNHTFSTFIKRSKLAKDLDQVFGDYALHVKEFSLEKFHFTSKETLLWASKVERDSALIPDKIIDCLTWISMESTR